MAGWSRYDDLGSNLLSYLEQPISEVLKVEIPCLMDHRLWDDPPNNGMVDTFVVGLTPLSGCRSLACWNNSSEEEAPSGHYATKKIMRYTDGTPLSDRKSSWQDGWRHVQYLMSPNDGLNEFLPVSSTGE